MPDGTFPVRHVHIGAGKLGLGLIADLSTRLGHRLVFLNRESTEPHHAILSRAKTYEIVYGRGDPYPIAGFDYHFFPSDHSQLTNAHEAIRAIADPRTGLLTTAVKDKHLQDLAPLIALGLIHRISNTADPPPHIFVIACQNTPRASDKVKQYTLDFLRDSRAAPTDVFTSLEGNASFCNSIVDRICSELQTQQDHLTLQAEEHFEWIVATPARHASTLQRLLPRYVTLAPPDQYEVYEKKKFWCVNAVHLGTAVYAKEKEIPLLADAIRNKEIEKRILLLQKELALALYTYAEGKFPDQRFSLREIENYNSLVFNRIMGSREDTMRRIIQELLELEDIDKTVTAILGIPLGEVGAKFLPHVRTLLQSFDLSNFFSKINVRLCQPIRLLVEHDYPHNSALDLLLSIFALLENTFTIYRQRIGNLRGLNHGRERA